MLLTEGWDCPSVDCVVVLRPTKVRSLYSQMIGRGTRLFPGKEELLLLDFLWHTERHELCHPAHLIANSDEVAKKMTENIEEAGAQGFAMDIEEAEVQAEKDVIAEREEALAKQLEEMRKRKRKLVDPLQFEMSIDNAGKASLILDRLQKRKEAGLATPKQIRLLEQRGFKNVGTWSFDGASKMINRIAANGWRLPNGINPKTYQEGGTHAV